MFKSKNSVVLLFVIFIILSSFIFGDITSILNDEGGEFLLSGGTGYTNLVETTYDDPNWILVTSHAILNEFRCDLINYEYVFNPCHEYLNRYWKLPPCTDTGMAFSILELEVQTTDSLYVRQGYGFQLYDNNEVPLDSNDLVPYGPFVEGPQFVSLSIWACAYPPDYGFEPDTFFVEGCAGGLENYSIVISRKLMNLECFSDVSSSCVEPSTPFEEHLITYYTYYLNDLRVLSDPNDPNSDCTDSDADNVVITSTLPVSVDFNSCSTGGSYDPNEHTIVWNLGYVDHDDWGLPTATVRVNEYAAPGNPIVNICTIAGEYSSSGEPFSYSVAYDTNVCCYCDTIFVDINATGKNSGTSWPDAFTDVQSAFNAAKNCPGLKVWIADGRYSPSFNGLCTFQIPDYANVYGGFQGWEQFLNQRNLSQGNTILDGDSFEERYNRSYNVVITGDQSVLDGAKVVEGIQATVLCDGKSSLLVNCTVDNSDSDYGILCQNNANFSLVDSNVTDNARFGFGITDSNAVVSGTSLTANYNIAVDCHNSDVMMQYCTVACNNSYGLRAEDSSNVTISNSIFRDNLNGYGIYGKYSEISVENCLIENNYKGIQVQNYSALVISNSHICNSIDWGIACASTTLTLNNSLIYGNGGEGVYFVEQAPVIENCIIYNNEDGGINLYSLASGGVIRNVTVVNNEGPGIYLYSDIMPDIRNCIIWGNSGFQLEDCDSTYSCVENGTTSNGNINENPLFYVDPCNPNNFHLTSSSPCVDTGDPCFVPYENELDIDGECRVVDGNDDGIVRVDMGADEFYHSKADLDLSEYVDFIDYSILANAWQNESGDDNYNESCDIEDNNSIDTNDLDLFCEDWLWEASWHSTKKMILDGLESRVGPRSVTGVSGSSTEKATQLPESTDVEGQIEDLLNWLDEVWLAGDLEEFMDYDDYIDFREAIKSLAEYDY